MPSAPAAWVPSQSVLLAQVETIDWYSGVGLGVPQPRQCSPELSTHQGPCCPREQRAESSRLSVVRCDCSICLRRLRVQGRASSGIGGHPPGGDDDRAGDVADGAGLLQHGGGPAFEDVVGMPGVTACVGAAPDRTRAGLRMATHIVRGTVDVFQVGKSATLMGCCSATTGSSKTTLPSGG